MTPGLFRFWLAGLFSPATHLNIPMKILLAEDDAMIGASMEQGLRQAGFTVDWARDGKIAEEALLNGTYALLLLDLGLPRQDGLALLLKIRRQANPVPVLIVKLRPSVCVRLPLVPVTTRLNVPVAEVVVVVTVRIDVDPEVTGFGAKEYVTPEIAGVTDRLIDPANPPIDVVTIE